VIKYLGSKRTLLPTLTEVFSQLAASGTVIDLFSGTSRVGHAAKATGYRVIANDLNAYAKELAQCYVQADLEEHEASARKLIEEFNALPGRPGYFTDKFCVQSRYFQPRNGERVDAIRERIEQLGLEPELRAVMLVSLMEAADRVDSTTGVQMAYLKEWAPRAYNELALRLPALLPRAKGGKGHAMQANATDAVASLEGDVCYIDPPYNQHNYLGNYHIWESLVLWDKPEVYGIACKRIDVRDRPSAFNRKREAEAAMADIVRRARTRHVVVSFNNEGYFTRSQIESMLRERGDVFVIEQDFKRYVGAQIGIYNPKGEVVGEVSHVRNRELIFVCSADVAALDRVRRRFELFGRKASYDAPELLHARGAELARADDVSAILARLRIARMEQIREELTVAASMIRPVLDRLVAEGKVAIEGERRGRAYRWLEDSTSDRAVPAIGLQLPLF
jgi:adenine-specific DNA-methyltransferase